MFTMSQENSEIGKMFDALDKEVESKHEELDIILDEVQDQIKFLHELHQEINSKE